MREETQFLVEGETGLCQHLLFCISYGIVFALLFRLQCFSLVFSCGCCSLSSKGIIISSRNSTGSSPVSIFKEEDEDAEKILKKNVMIKEQVISVS